MNFGQRFRELRIEKGLTQQDLVNDFNNKYNHNFSKSSISQYEHNKRKPETEALKNFALYFNVSIDYLLGISDDKDKIIDKEVLSSNFLGAISDFFKNDDIDRDQKDKLFKELSQMYFDSLK